MTIIPKVQMMESLRNELTRELTKTVSDRINEEIRNNLLKNRIFIPNLPYEISKGDKSINVELELITMFKIGEYRIDKDVEIRVKDKSTLKLKSETGFDHIGRIDVVIYNSYLSSTIEV